MMLPLGPLGVWVIDEQHTREVQRGILEHDFAFDPADFKIQLLCFGFGALAARAPEFLLEAAQRLEFGRRVDARASQALSKFPRPADFLLGP